MGALNVVCVETGNYCGRGAEYVKNLRAQVRRHLSLPHTFHVFTDGNPEDYPGCVVHKAEFEGWWQKLAIFKRGTFDGRVLFIDLDTYIVRNIDEIASYGGHFATLRDFLRMDGLGPAVMMFDPKWAEFIYDEWAAEGFPRRGNGDQTFIENLNQGRMRKEVDILQDMFPGQFVSYKVHARDEIPQEAAFVCFHGKPRPHEAGGWAKQAWEMGGVAAPKFNPVLNVPNVTMLAQAEENLKRDLPTLLHVSEHDGTALIVGGGPSLADTLPSLRFHKNRGGKIFALNGVHDWLIDRGIVPDYHVILDARQDNVCFVKKPHKDCTYLLAAQCHPDLFDALKDHKVIMWVGFMDGAEALAKRIPKPLVIVGGGNTVGLKTMCLVHVWGYRKQRLFGFDSSYRADANHAYPQPLNDGEETLEILCEGRKFICAKWMARQAAVFQTQSQTLARAGAVISVHGDGLIPWIAKCESEEMENAA